MFQNTKRAKNLSGDKIELTQQSGKKMKARKVA